MWLHGPNWVSNPAEFPPEIIPSVNDVTDEVTPACFIANAILTLQEPTFDLNYSNSLSTMLPVADHVRNFIHRCWSNRPELPSSINLLLSQEQRIYFPNIVDHFIRSAPLDRESKQLVLLNNLQYCKERGMVVAHTRIIQDGSPVDLPFVPRESRLVKLILTEMHQHHHHCPASTVVTLCQSRPSLNALRILSAFLH